MVKRSKNPCVAFRDTQLVAAKLELLHVDAMLAHMASTLMCMCSPEHVRHMHSLPFIPQLDLPFNFFSITAPPPAPPCHPH